MKLIWDEQGERLYETGADRGVLYVQDNKGNYPMGKAWNGLTAVSENPSGAEETALYANNHKYASLRSAENEEGSIKAYTYPDEWMECDGSKSITTGISVGQQSRRAFGLTWRTIIGNDIQLDDYGYKIHFLYGATASPSEKEYASVNDSPEAIEFSWEYKANPVDTGIEGYKPTSTMTIDSTKVTKATLKAIEDIIYGTDETDPRLPSIKEIHELVMRDTENGPQQEPEPPVEEDEDEYEIVESPTYGTNPSTEGWYELVDGEYVLTEDTSVESGKDYYTKVGA